MDVDAGAEAGLGRREARAFTRAFSGAFLFGVLLLFTMEMWWIGIFADLWKLLLFLGPAFAVNLHLIYFAGFKDEGRTLREPARPGGGRDRRRPLARDHPRDRLRERLRPAASPRAERDGQEEGRSVAEWTTLAISIAVIATLVGIITHRYLAGGDAAVIEIQPALDEVLQDAGAYYLPVRITNRGDRTAEDVRITVMLMGVAGPQESSEVTFR